MRLILLCALAVTAWGETPRDVLDFFRTAGEELADQDSKAFLDHFDHAMEGYQKLDGEIQLLVNYDISSTIEIVTDDGDDRARELKLDWIVRVSGGRPRREIVTAKIERQGKKWKITSFQPVEFFAYDLQR